MLLPDFCLCAFEVFFKRKDGFFPFPPESQSTAFASDCIIREIIVERMNFIVKDFFRAEGDKLFLQAAPVNLRGS